MVYLAVLVMGLIFSLLNSNSKTYFYSYLLILLVLASLRYGVGPDYFGYEYLYSLANISLIDQVGESTGQELIFRLFGSTLNSLDLSYQSYLAIAALITLSYIGRICRRYSHYPIFSLYLFYCLFYFVWVFSGIRQGLALAIGVYYLLDCIETRNHIKFVVALIVVALIHASALILLLFYIVAHLNIRTKYLLLGVFVCFCISLIPTAYLEGIVSHLPFHERIEYYYGRDAATIDYFDFKSISRLALLLLFGVGFSSKIDKSDGVQKGILSLYVTSFGIYYALRFVEILAANASMYGFVLIILIMPNMYGRLKRRNNAQLMLMFGLMFSVAYFFKTLLSMEDMSSLNHNSLLTPYTNIFNKSGYFTNTP